MIRSRVPSSKYNKVFFLAKVNYLLIRGRRRGFDRS